MSAWTRALALAAAIAVVGVAAPARAVVTLQKTSNGGAYTGGTLTFQLAVKRVGSETALVVHDPTPAGLTLLRVAAGSATLDCTTTPSGALGPDYPMATCNVGGELQVQVSDLASNPATLVLSYRAPSMAGMVTNTATATCTGGCAPAPMSSATASVVTPTMTVAKSGPATARAGDTVRWNITVTNTGPFALDSFAVTDAVPGGAAVADVAIAGATFSASDLASPKTAPDGSVASLVNATTVGVQGKTLASMAAYSFAIDARIDTGAVDGATITNVASATPLGGAPATSPAVTTTVQTQAPPLQLQKRVSPASAKIGDPVTYTLTVTPTGGQPGPITLVDPIDPALKIVAVKVNGAVIVCGAAPVPAGEFTLACGADGHTVTLALPAGVMLSVPLTVGIAATVLPTAGAQVQNIATLTNSMGAAQTASQPLMI